MRPSLAYLAVAVIFTATVGCDPPPQTSAGLEEKAYDDNSTGTDASGTDSTGTDSTGTDSTGPDSTGPNTSTGGYATDPSTDTSGGNVAGAPTTQVRLSTCVALGQTLPNGTCMSFSAEYRFIGSGPRPDAAYFWVIKPSRGGDAVATRVDMRNPKGTLQGIVESLRPDYGPFDCHIVEEVDGTRTKVSRDFPLPALGGV
jgi:hypothetical protein